MDSENGPVGGLANTPPENREGRRGRKWPWVVGGLAVLGILFAAATIAALALAFGSGASGISSSSPIVYDEEYISGEGSDKVAVVPVEGVISSADNSVSSTQATVTPEGLKEALRQAKDDDSVKAVVLEVNSPGGGVTASDEMHQSILDFEKSTGEPIVVSMGDVAASGGYYISTAADKIVANETTLTGSLGVILELSNFSELADKYGYKEEIIKSGKYKDMGSQFRKLTPEERSIFQKIVDENYDQFVDVISKGRDLPKEKVREIADGRVYSGEQAKKLGLVDEFGGLDEATKLSREMAGVKDARVVRYVQKPTLTDTLLARLAPQKPEAVQLMEAAGIDFSAEPEYLYRRGR